MAAKSDLELLRAYEPVLMCTKGELFFPTDVDAYVRNCSLWIEEPGGGERRLVPAGELTLDRLGRAEAEWPGRHKHLRFVQEETLREEARRYKGVARTVIPKSGRLAAVGVLGRVLDILMKLSLLIRGAVPGGLTFAAVTRYRERVDNGGVTYYGRVTREGGYTILQYWFFYAMNDWRTIYGGVNDHEADWERVTVYVVDNPDGTTRPVWVGASSHEYHGDDLRRSWADPDLHRDGDHPIVYVGAGSHSHQMLPGDYLIQVDPSFLRGPMRAWRWITHRIFRADSVLNRHGIGVPFVDYARGDGMRLGPGGDREWSAVLIDDDTPWLTGYRGLWGRDTGDFFDGERAPSGPRYERDGTIRRSWADPLAWVGLQKVAPTEPAARAELRAHVRALDDRLRTLDADVISRRDRLRQLHSARIVLEREAHSRPRAREYAERIAALEMELGEVYETRVLTADERDTHLRALAADTPLVPSPTGHLKAPHLPYSSGTQRSTRFLHLWVALSTPLLLISLALPMFVLNGQYTFYAMIGVVVVFAAVDSVARRKFVQYLIGLAVIAVVVGLVVGVVAAFVVNWRIAITVPVAVIVVLLLVVNVRELLRR
ncbi:MULTISPECIES: hypothetical protein [Nocardiopsis]|uniref:Uncharacterized protein n=1 Tax=Nocardiopsis dassonvillei (strain ATCC 23218 / DSM 43111 / CIP 107115 / JCM 7437 / KCTC 9190 / NBRC 14626 / NCTC 10488 / NRRL B-5397 / IMRU 509) TaxID=446468 RepID=D7AXQ5_NOCDD|nr:MULTISPECIES: hypothetical protein [Nocardiopsis]ADH67959.1 conserved hypothetical protein [Nocardiopsis dassonvillei subsp. dassonvillei DSM 43111]APC36110.1 hypothetical protein A9R04_16065 [Nocardiopsis dassonvillei]NKY81835.1 hypothetical protein [Nocardiopsis dassonvillei]VEI88458.1 Uncharacterised protein [Nocardiopsis dassonvillei]